MPSRGYHTARLVCTRLPTLDLGPLAPPVGICDGWRAGEVPERPKGHAWRACVPTRYRGFESLPLRLTDTIRGPVHCSRGPAARCVGGFRARPSALPRPVSALASVSSLRRSPCTSRRTRLVCFLAPRASGGGG